MLIASIIKIGRTDAEPETPILWPPHAKSWLIGKDPDAGRDGRGWDGWMASLTWWTWVWVNFGSWWWTGRPGVLRFMGSQRIGHDWATELNYNSTKYQITQLKNGKNTSIDISSKTIYKWSISIRQDVQDFPGDPEAACQCRGHDSIPVLRGSMLWGSWARELQLLKSARLESVLRNKRSHRNKKHAPQLESSLLLWN